MRCDDVADQAAVTPLTAPSLEEWRALGPDAREAFIIDANTALCAVLDQHRETIGHNVAREAALDTLSGYFRRIRRQSYVASDLAVHYPGEITFAPDLFAVVGVQDPGDSDERMAWVVADEGRGLDLVLEVLHRGEPDKDLLTNVAFYARLGIAEYFVYDRRKHQLYGYFLPDAKATRYLPIQPLLGRLPSQVLQLDLGVVGHKLRFVHGEAQIPTSVELLSRVNALLEEVEARAAQEQARADAEQARAEAEQARAEAAISGLRGALIALLAARGLSLSEGRREQVARENAPDTLAAWLGAAVSAQHADDVFGVRNTDTSYDNS